MPSLLKMMAEMGLNITPFQAGMKQAEQAANKGMNAVGQSIKGAIVGYFGWRALENAVINVGKQMAQMKDHADQFGITTDQVQQLGAAADSVGLSFEDMGAALMKVKNLREAIAGGDAGAVKAANLFGIGKLVQDGAEAIDVMDAVGKKMQGLTVNRETLDAMREIFGKSGPRLAAAMQALGKDFGPKIAEGDIDQVDEMEAAVKRLGKEWKTAVAPGIANAAYSLTAFLEKWREVRKETEKENVPWYGLPVKWTAEAGEAAGRAMNKPAEQGNKAMADGLSKFFGSALTKAFGGGGGKPVAVGQIVNPSRIAALREAEDKLSEAREGLAFGRLDKSGKELDLKRRMKETDADIVTLQNHKAADEENEIIRKTRISELQKEQVGYMQQMDALQNKSGYSLSSYLDIARAGGFSDNPTSYAPQSAGRDGNRATNALHRESVKALEEIKQVLKQAGTLILGGGG